MKTIKSICAAIFCCALVAGFSSCSNVEDPLPEPTPNEEGTTYEVSLNLGGEYTEVSEEPLGRSDEAAHKKYYGINVYCMKTDGSEDTYSNYAYGVFDNVADIRITLLGGYKYKFECTSVTEDIDTLFIDREYIGNNYECFLSCPFRESKGSDFKNEYRYVFHTKKINYFIISQNIYLMDIKYGNCKVDNHSYPMNPRMDRFYGELKDFLPSSGPIATIPMKRIAFGIKVVVNGVPDGNLIWEDSEFDIQGWDSFDKVALEKGLRFNCEGCTGMEKQEYSQIYTFANVYDCWLSKEVYTQNFTINFTWTRANGYKQYFNEKITVKRNVMTTITVNLKGGANDVTIGINEDDTPMGNEDVNVEYDGGDLNDTPINPEE